MTRVLVTGADGQLGKSIQKIASGYSKLEFMFTNSKGLDITDPSKVARIFKRGGYQYCINCAAYTHVEKAESEKKKAFAVNAEGVKNVAKSCLKNDVTLIHISTDYVFDGEKKTPYTIDDEPNPINVYGASKLKGEEFIKEILERYFIVRTSWLYSEFGKNFYKTILRKARTEKILHVTYEQRGRPTHAENLAKFTIDKIICEENDAYGIHHFTDGKTMTWYDFAVSIIEQNNLNGLVNVTREDKYRSFVKRPKNSVLL